MIWIGFSFSVGWLLQKSGERKNVIWGLVGKAFSRAGVEEGFNTFDVCLGQLVKAVAFGEILADEAVGVFVESAFP